jgi:hypothetical protein
MCSVLVALQLRDVCGSGLRFAIPGGYRDVEFIAGLHAALTARVAMIPPASEFARIAFAAASRPLPSRVEAQI